MLNHGMERGSKFQRSQYKPISSGELHPGGGKIIENPSIFLSCFSLTILTAFSSRHQDSSENGRYCNDDDLRPVVEKQNVPNGAPEQLQPLMG